MGFGGIIPDSAGSFIAAYQGYFQGCFSPLLAEAISLREVLSWIKTMHIGNLIIESDSQLLVYSTHNSVEDTSSIGLVVDDCKALIGAIDHCEVRFVYRSANDVAHSIARAARSTSGWHEWVQSCPSFIFDVMATDLN